MIIMCWRTKESVAKMGRNYTEFTHTPGIIKADDDITVIDFCDYCLYTLHSVRQKQQKCWMSHGKYENNETK